MKTLFSLLISFLAAQMAFGSTKVWDEYSDHERQEALLRTTFEQEHRRFRRDCSGYVEAILRNLGHDIGEFTHSYGIRTNGVSQIYEYVGRSGSIYKDELPKRGDLIFFSNTYDVNRDGRQNDGLSHIGVVTGVDNDGTISFKHVIHQDVQTDYINLNKPNLHTYRGKIINSYIRRASKNSAYPALTSQLFDFYGSLSP